MKNLLRRLHLGVGQDDHSDGGGGSSRLSFSQSTSITDSKPSSSLSGWLHVARNTLNQAGNPKHKKDDASDRRGDEKDDTASRAEDEDEEEEDEHCTAMDAVSPPTASSLAVPALARERRSSDSSVATSAGVATDAKGIAFERAQTAALLQLASDQALFLQDEELQVRVAMALSVRDDPEAAAIETAKDLSLGSDPSLSNSTAEVLAYRYWKYNALNYDDKVVDGFYDVYGVASDSSSEMPSLIDLQETPFVDQMTWEVVLVNRATDNDLVNLEQKAISIALNSRVSMAGGLKKSGLIHRIAEMVADEMGGPVVDADLLHKMWRTNSTKLRLSVKNIVLPLGRLQIGLGRHRALLFKVLADAVGIPCQLVKGRHFTGSDEGAVNIIKVDAGREYIIDLMGAPGTLIPSDVSGIVGAGSNVNLDQEDFVPSMLQIPDDAKNGFVAGRKVHSIARGGKEEILADLAPGPGLEKANVCEVKPMERHQSEPTELKEVHAISSQPTVNRSASHWRSPSWTEGIGLPAVKDIKVKDVQYMMDAAKENPKLAQRLHDVLLESGVQAPPDLFSEISPKQLQARISEERKLLDESQGGKALKRNAGQRKEKNIVGPGRPPVPTYSYSSSSEESGKDGLQRLNSVEGLRERQQLDPSNLNSSLGLSRSTSKSSGAAVVQSSSPVLPSTSAVSLVQENLPPELIKHVPVAAAAAATAAVVASSMMVVAAAKLDIVLNPTPEVPVAAAATAKAAFVVATSAVVGRQLDLPFPEPVKEDDSEKGGREDINQRQEEADAHVKSSVDSGTEDQGSGGADKYPEDARVSDKSSGPISGKSDRVLDDVAEWEIPWEELAIGERIGLGSYGEVYHGDWHGTEVAVKKFLNQDISGDALEEFRSEVRLMKRMCHPNVVLFMGAVMRAPNLSIVTEFLPRGSLYRLIHRSNSQLDERRRMRMALDVARGMNYLHNSTPVIVHRDLKSPNLLVDKNWVVKVCDFGLSRLKHNTFLSSKSTTGSPEWMAPEVLRNEPSNEKSDVYSFGVILWELATLQQPWAGMNSMQVVGAVGFQHRILDIPGDLDPVIVKIIQQCWQSDPSARPSFAEIMSALKPLQKLFLHTQTAKA